MLFKTEDNITLVLQIVAVALAIVILVTGTFLVVWDVTVGRMTGERYISNGGMGLNEGTINEGEGGQGNYGELGEIDVGDDDTDLGGEAITPDSLSSLQANIKSWMNTGTAVHESYVTNFLLIGNDADSTRADAMLIVSVNNKTKTITLASILRDQYSYIVHNGLGRFDKFHHSCAYGGPSLLIQMIERYYKVTVDNYACVNFETLPEIIDIAGGVEVTLTDAEAKYISTDWYQTRLNKAGTYTLTGAEALIYMRIRKGNTGGDEARTSRQQNVVKALIAKAKTMSKDQLVKIISAAIPYVKTGLDSWGILGYATTAFDQGWFNYELKQVRLPDSECSTSFMAVTRGTNLWYWKVDYPIAAQKLQMALYGATNITLQPGRKSWIK